MVIPAQGDEGREEDFGEAFRREYKSEFGFLLDTKGIVVDEIKVSSPILCLVRKAY
jgi:5-oxoprolinase (ATP-hydrolysing)